MARKNLVKLSLLKASIKPWLEEYHPTLSAEQLATAIARVQVISLVPAGEYLLEGKARRRYFSPEAMPPELLDQLVVAKMISPIILDLRGKKWLVVDIDLEDINYPEIGESFGIDRAIRIAKLDLVRLDQIELDD
jgi:hypothetical protein